MTQGSELRVFQQVVEDMETAEANARAEGWDLKFLQLSPGRFRGLYKSAALPGMFLTYEDYGRTSLVATGQRPDDVMPIVLWQSAGPSLRCCGQEVTKDSIVMPWRSPDVDYAIEGGGRAYSIQLDRASYRSLLTALPWLEEDSQRESPRLSKRSIGRLKHHLKMMLGSSLAESGVQPLLTNARALATNFLSLITEGLAGWNEEQDGCCRSLDCERPVHLKRTRDLMEARPKEPLSLAALCAETGASARTLSNAFVKRYGVSPVKYHSLMRLEGARRDLKRSRPDETSVTDVATDWGFWHLGRFSQCFRLQFGECPSAILVQSPRPLPMPAQSGRSRPPATDAPCSPSAPKAA